MNWKIGVYNSKTDSQCQCHRPITSMQNENYLLELYLFLLLLQSRDWISTKLKHT